jgi:hypothetical protein
MTHTLSEVEFELYGQYLRKYKEEFVASGCVYCNNM